MTSHKRFVPQRRLQVTEHGTHVLLQMRLRVLDDDLDTPFQERSPGFRPTAARERPA